MAVLNSATASGRTFFAGTLTTTANTVVYTSPSNNTNVTNPSSTAYVKEIVICNYSSSSVTVYITLNGVSMVAGLTVNANDTKVLSGLNTMLYASTTIQAWAGTASAISCIISGVEVQ